MMITVALVLIALGLVLGAPVFCVFAAIPLLGWFADGTPISAVGTDVNRLSSNFVFITIPLFTFAGYLLGESGAPRRLVNLSRAFLGWMPGGLAIVSIVGCSLFTAFTGASGVTIVALGALLLPALLQERYKENFSLALITTGGSLGLLFAPSVPLILYGVITQTPIADMFVAGVLPGVAMVIILSIVGVVVAIRSGVPRTHLKWKEIREALWDAKWEVPLPIVVLGGIYGGFFAVSEAAAVTAFWVLIAEVLIYREISFAQLKKVTLESMVMVGGIMVIVATAMASTNYFIDVDVPQKIFEVIREHVSTRFGFLLLLNIFLFILGMLLDIFSAIVVVVPIITPIARGYDVNLVHLGIVFLANMQIGYMTPPFGMGLFISSFRFNKGILQITLACLPFIGILFASVLLITYWPDLSLVILRMMGKPY